jgi:hypothetical protein
MRAALNAYTNNNLVFEMGSECAGRGKKEFARDNAHPMSMP